jgi:protein-tyrosine phosphatase
MRRKPTPAAPGWKMQVFEVIPGLFIATRLETSTEYATLDVDAIVDLEDWEMAWVPPVPRGRIYVSLPMDDDDEVDPKVRELAQFIASLVNSGRRVLVHCTEGLNRSGVVVARALMEMGLPASDAIDLVRRQRGPSIDGFRALGNPAFVDWLHREGGMASRERHSHNFRNRGPRERS